MMFRWARRRKGPKGYQLLAFTWSPTRCRQAIDQYLSLDYGLSVERTIFGRYYIWGRK